MADPVDAVVSVFQGIGKAVAWTYRWMTVPSQIGAGSSKDSSQAKSTNKDQSAKQEAAKSKEEDQAKEEKREEEQKKEKSELGAKKDPSEEAKQEQKESKTLEAQASLPLVKRSAEQEAEWQKKQAEFLSVQRPIIQKEFDSLARSLGIAVQAGEVEKTQAAVYESLGVSEKNAAGVRRIAANSKNPQAAIYATLLGFQQESASPIVRVGHANAEKAVMVLKAALSLNMSVDSRDLPALVTAIQADAGMKDDPNLKLLIQLSQIQTDQQKDAPARNPDEWRAALLTKAEAAGIKKDSAEQLIAKYELEMKPGLKSGGPAPQPEKQQAEAEEAELPEEPSEELLEQKYRREEKEQKVAEIVAPAPLTVVADAVQPSAPVSSASSLAASAASGQPVINEAQPDKQADDKKADADPVAPAPKTAEKPVGPEVVTPPLSQAKDNKKKTAAKGRPPRESVSFLPSDLVRAVAATEHKNNAPPPAAPKKEPDNAESHLLKKG